MNLQAKFGEQEMKVTAPLKSITVVEAGKPAYQEKTVTPTEEMQRVVADAGFDAIEVVNVEPIPSEYSKTSDATAIEEDILYGKTAYIGDGKVTGTFSLDEEIATQTGLIEQISETLNAVKPKTFALMRKLLPDEYQEVEYIESTGTQYIDTGKKINTATDTVELVFENTEPNTYKWFFGEHDNNARLGLGSGDGVDKRNVAYGNNTYKVADGLQYFGKHIFVADQNGAFIDETKVANHSSFSSVSTLYLFNLNLSDGSYVSKSKIWRYVHTRNGEDIINLIPCYRKSDKVVGMYDLVSNEFFTNNGSGEFLYKSLPFGYKRELRYIESTGTQWIATDIIPNTNTKIELYAGGIDANTFSITGSSGGWFVGSRTAYQDRAFGFYYNPSGQALYGAFGNSQQSTSIPTKDFYGKDHLFVLDKSGLYLDGEKKVSFNTSFTGQYPLSLFTINLAGVKASLLCYKTYYLKVWENDTLVRDLIPVLDLDDVPCMYDKVSGAFFYNQGDGEFAYEIKLSYTTELQTNNDKLQVILDTANSLPEYEEVILQEKTVTPSTVDQMVVPSDGYTALSKVIVIGDENLKPENIKKDEIVFGIVGTHEGGGDDATEGLAYELNSQYSSYAICSGIGTSTETDIVIAKKYDDLYVTEIKKDAFRNNKNIKSVVFSDSITSVNANAFCNCTSLTDVRMKNSVRYINEAAFKDCAALETIEIPRGVSALASSIFSYCYNLKTVILNEGLTSFSGSSDLFNGCNSLKKLDIPSTVKTFNRGSISPAKFDEINFRGTINDLAGMSLGTTVNGYNIEIYTPTRAKKFTIQNEELPENLYIDNSAVNGMTFGFLPQIKSVNLSSKVSNISGNSFYKSSNLEQITVDEANKNYICENNCVILKANNRIVLGCKNSIIPESATSIGDWAFSGSGVNNIVIPENIKSIGDYAFAGCENLGHISIPEGITRIAGTFMGCGSFSVDLPNSLTTIGSNTFSGTNIETLVLPDSIKSISGYWSGTFGTIVFGKNFSSLGSYFFYYGGSAKRLDFSQCVSIPTLQSSTLPLSKVGQIKVPASLIDSWKKATNWSNLASIIVTEFTNEL